MRTNSSRFGSRVGKKSKCRKGKPCGSICIPRQSKCGESNSVKSPARRKSANLFDEKKYQAELYRRGFVGGSAAVTAIVAGAGIQIAYDLKKIQPDSSQEDPPPDYDSLTPGDLVRRKSVLGGVTAYHYAVYAGKDEESGEHYVVHTQAAGKENQESASVVVRTPIESNKEPFFKVPEKEMYQKEGARKISKEEALARAEKMVGKPFTYAIFSSNCESFARAVVEGAAYSSQGDSVSSLTRGLLDFFTETAIATTKKQYLRSRNRMNSKEVLDYLDTRRVARRRDSFSAASGKIKRRYDYVNTLELQAPSSPPSNVVDSFCDQVGMKRPESYSSIVDVLTKPLGSTQKAVKHKMITDYIKMMMGVINRDELISSRSDSREPLDRGRHPPRPKCVSNSSLYRRIRSDSLPMNNQASSLSPHDIALEISESHGINVDGVYETEIREDGAITGIVSSSGDFFEFEINTRSVGLTDRPDITQSVNERSRGILAGSGIDYRGDNAFEYLRGLEARLDAPFGAGAGGQCGRGWKPGPGGKCVRSGGGMGRAGKIGAGIAVAGALGAGAVALNRARNKPKALPAAGGAITPYSGMKSASPNRIRQAMSGARNRLGGAASGVKSKFGGAVSGAKSKLSGTVSGAKSKFGGAVSGAKRRVGAFAQKFRKPQSAPASRRENPSGAITVASRRVDGLTRLDAPFGRKAKNGKCGKGWEPGPGGKCVRSRGGGMGRAGKIGAGIAVAGALGAGAVALNRARNKPKALPAAGQTGAGQSSLTQYSKTKALKGRIRQGIGAVKDKTQKVRETAKAIKFGVQAVREIGKEQYKQSREMKGKSKK